MESRSDECPCTVNEAELFDPTSKQIVLNSFQEEVIFPTAGVNNSGGVMEFSVTGSTDEFIDLNDTELVVDVKILKTDGSNLANTDNVAPVNNWLHSMFSDIKLEFGTTTVEGGDGLYPYKAYFYNLFTHDFYSKRTQLANSGWYKDTHGQMNKGTNENVGYKDRKALVTESKHVQLAGPILLDTFLQNRYLLPNIKFKLTLTRSKSKFQTLIHTAANVNGRATEVQVNFLSAKLIVRKVKAMSSFIESIEDRLMVQNAIYPIQRTVMNTCTIPTGTTTYHNPELFNSQLPKLVFIGLVSNTAFSGSYTENPFNFEHYSVKSIKLSDTSGTAQIHEFRPDFTNGLVAEEYNGLFKAMGIYNVPETFDVTLAEFCKGYTIYAFNLTPDGHTSGHQQIARNAHIKLDLAFDTALPNAVSVVAMAVMDGVIQISKRREIFCSWNAAKS